MNYRKMPCGYGIVQTAIMKLNITIQAKAFYSLLASYTGSKKYCFPSIKQMSIDMNISEKMVIKYIKELVENKLIIKSKLNDNKWNHSNKYEIFYIENDTDEVSETYDNIIDDNPENVTEDNTDGYLQVNFKNNPKVNHYINNNNNNNNSINNNNINNNSTNIYKKDKIQYRDNIYLTEKEYHTLIESYNIENTEKLIEYLANYKIEKNYKTRSDYLTILRWVVDACKVKKLEKKEVKSYEEYRIIEA